MGVEERPSFETLSAFVDNELDAVEGERVRSWVAHDDVVAREVRALQALKANVANMPSTGSVLPDGIRAKTYRNPALTLMAASLAFGLLLLGVYRIDFANPFDSESTLSEQIVAAYDDWDPHHAMAVHSSSQNLEFFLNAGLSQQGIEALRFGDYHVTHSSYVGPGGCRVSLFEFPPQALEPQTLSDGIRQKGDALAIGWISGHSAYVMVARRMNEKRFDAIATALQDLGREEPELRVAEQDIPRSACVG